MSGGDDWQVGDLALCVDDGPPRKYDCYIECSAKFIAGLRRGCLYTVLSVEPGKTGRVGIKVAPKTGGLSDRFRKIKPLSDEERDTFLADLREPAFLSSGPQPAVETPATHPSPSVAGGFGEVRSFNHAPEVAKT